MTTTFYIAMALAFSLAPLDSMAVVSFRIVQAETEIIDKVYRLSAEIEYEFNNQMMDALHNGVAITMAIDMSIYRERSFMWDERISSLKQIYQIRYRALTKQYMVKNLNTGFIDNFSRIEQVLEKLGVVDKFPLIDSKFLSKKGNYYTLIRARIDIESLPVPLRLRAYVNSNWKLKSPWYLCRM